MKWLIAFVVSLLGVATYAQEQETRFPPVPKWEPSFFVANEVILDRMVYYTDSNRDIIVFSHGTAVLLPDDLSDEDAESYALGVLADIFNNHPDFRPSPMDDGNILVSYNYPAYNVVIEAFVQQHMDEVRSMHLEGLAAYEVLITPAGNNVFDEFGMKALYGRAFMFMDAQNPEVGLLYRHDSADGI